MSERSALMPDYDWLLLSKLRPPRFTTHMLQRERIVDQTVGSGSWRVVLLDAPAGFGKSTLLAQCFHTIGARGVKVCWLSLDEDDQSPEQFLSYLIASIESTGASLPSLRVAMQNQLSDSRPEAVLNHLLALLERLPERYVLFIDDYHRVSGSSADRLMELLISRLPENLSLFIATRGRAEIQVERLRLSGQLLLLDQDDLSFTEAEIAAFGNDFSPAETRLLAVQTGGWPVAVQLAVWWLKQNQDHESVRSLKRYTGRSRDLAAYLTEQIFVSLPERLQEFLLCTSITDSFDTGLANALTGRDDAGVMIDALDRQGLPLMTVDDERSIFRYHHLLQQFLRDQLRRRSPQRVPELHTSAAHYLADLERPFEAARHATEAGDASLAAVLLERAGGWLTILKGGLWNLLKFRDLPETALRKHPDLRLAQIYLMAREGDVRTAREAFDELRRITGDFREFRGRDWNARVDVGRIVVNLALNIYEAEPIGHDDVKQLEEALTALPEIDPNLRALTGHLSAIAAYDAAEFAECERLTTVMSEEWRRLGNLSMTNYMTSYQARALMAQGRAQDAEAVLFTSLQEMGTFFQEASRSGAVAPLFLAEIRYEQDRLVEARRLLKQTFSMVVDVESWFDLDTSGYRTAAFLALHDEGVAQSLQLIERARETVHRRGLTLTTRYLELLGLRVLIMAGRGREAAAEARRVGAVELMDTSVDEDPWAWRLAYPAQLVGAELELTLGSSSKALTRLQRLQQRLNERGYRRCELESQVLTAIASCRLNYTQEAAAALESAVAMAVPQGFTRVFLDRRELVQTLVDAIRKPALARRLSSEACSFIRSLDTNHRPPAVPAPPRSPVGAPSRTEDIDVARSLGLSARETEVLSLMKSGLSSKEIATALGVSESTVKTHRKNLYRKLDVSRRSAAIAKLEQATGDS